MLVRNITKLLSLRNQILLPFLADAGFEPKFLRLLHTNRTLHGNVHVTGTSSNLRFYCLMKLQILAPFIWRALVCLWSLVHGHLWVPDSRAEAASCLRSPLKEKSTTFHVDIQSVLTVVVVKWSNKFISLCYFVRESKVFWDVLLTQMFLQRI